MNVLYSLLLLVALLLGYTGNTCAQEPFFYYGNYVSPQADTLPYRISYPDDYSKKIIQYLKTENPVNPLNYSDSTKYPLVIFLHGSGERGNDNERQLIHSAKIFTNQNFRKNFPAFVLIPQCPVNKRWVEVDWKLDSHIMPDTPSVPMKGLISVIDNICKTLPVDTQRIYITGLSMGGFGTWDLISRFPGKFAAAAPVCGGGDEHKAGIIKKIPIWAFHGAKDKVVKVSRSQNMINAIKNNGGNPKYSEYPDVGHDAWNKAYVGTELFQWMFEQKK